MTEPILIPVWTIIVFVPMFFSLFVLLIASAKSQAVMKSDIKNINERLCRIENLLDHKIISK